MLFNSYDFIFLFLPVAFLVTLLFARYTTRYITIVTLTLFSLIFYAYWNYFYLSLLLFSIGVNYVIGRQLLYENVAEKKRALLVSVGVIGNLVLLGYFKYAGFFARNINYVADLDIPVLNIAIPLGISFFTFQQISYLVDTYRKQTRVHSLGEYALFVSFFPQLIAGPIVCHKDFFYQIRHKRFLSWSQFGFAVGLSFFIVGLFKKVVIADRLGLQADLIFLSHRDYSELALLDYWVGVTAYTLQIYFDFSGYTDMAIGLARMFGVKLPTNFNSPYKASSIIDFWGRWHITLSNFLKRYLYFSLGGNRKGDLRKYSNLLITMLIGGLWHGAGFSFVLWGGLHGLYLIVNHFWRKIGFSLNKSLSIALTFLCVLFAWVPFRAIDLDQTILIWQGMFDLSNGIMPTLFDMTTLRNSGLFIVSLAIVFFAVNSQQFKLANYKKVWYSVGLSLMFVISVLSMSSIQKFIYYQF